MKDGPLRRPHKSVPKPKPAKEEAGTVAVCPCGSREKVWVHSHFQCARCGRVLSSCCEGEAW